MLTIQRLGREREGSGESKQETYRTDYRRLRREKVMGFLHIPLCPPRPAPREILKRNRYLASKKWSRELATYGDSCMVHLRRRLQMVNQDLKVQREGSPCRSPFPFGPASYRLLYSPSGQSLPLTEILLCL